MLKLPFASNCGCVPIDALMIDLVLCSTKEPTFVPRFCMLWKKFINPPRAHPIIRQHHKNTIDLMMNIFLPLWRWRGVTRGSTICVGVSTTATSSMPCSTSCSISFLDLEADLTFWSTTFLSTGNDIL